MSDDVDDFLAHYGVPGMKWGKRKASAGPVDKQGNLKAPSHARTLLLGVAGNSKKRYTDPAALAKRTQAGKNMRRGLMLSIGAVAVNTIGGASSNPSVKAGAEVVGSLLSIGGTAVGVTGIVQSLKANSMETTARARG